MDNHVVELEANLVGQVGQEGDKGDNKDEGDVETSMVTPLLRIFLGRLYLKRLILRDYKRPRKKGK